MKKNTLKINFKKTNVYKYLQNQQLFHIYISKAVIGDRQDPAVTRQKH